jgi:hypothetical protein
MRGRRPDVDADGAKPDALRRDAAVVMVVVQLG